MLHQAVRGIRCVQDYRTSGLLSRSRTVGYQPRVAIRRDMCTRSSSADEHPREHGVIEGAADWAATLYRRHAPEAYARHLKQADRVLPEWRMGGHSVFTSGIVNRNNALHYHRDKGNAPGAWSAMFVFRDGSEGGELVLPELGVAVACPNNSLFLFNGADVVHGVAPIKMQTPRSYRLSLVLYTLGQMWRCLPLTEEVARLRERRREREGRPR